MKPTFVVALCIVVTVGTAQQSAAKVYVAAGGSLTGEIPDLPGVGDTQPYVQNVADHRDDFYNHWEAYALGGAFTNTEECNMCLRAQAKARTTQFFGAAPYSHATAKWSDHLVIEHPDIVVSYVPIAYAYFQPMATGHGSNGYVELESTVFQNVAGEEVFSVSQRSEMSFGDEGEYGKFTDLHLGLRVPLELMMNPGLEFEMQLTVGASASAFDPSRSVADVDYYHTAVLPPIFIGDANGNPIPGLADASISIVGVDLASYAVTTTRVPEPATGAMLALLAMLMRCLSRVRANVAAS